MARQYVVQLAGPVCERTTADIVPKNENAFVLRIVAAAPPEGQIALVCPCTSFFFCVRDGHELPKNSLEIWP
jgi:hypothetical protein